MEGVVISPFIVIGRIFTWLNPLKKEFHTYFFFPFYHTGGAEKVHALVAQATGDHNCIIFFTRKSVDDVFYKDFKKAGCTIKDISKYTDNKWLYFLNLIFRGIITGWINGQRHRPLVFNGQCNFGYKISPWVHREIPQVELIHSFNTFSRIRIPFIPFISRTIMISQVRIEDHIQQYKTVGIPPRFISKIEYIVNGIPLPTVQKEKDYTGKLTVLYSGRATEEKRVYLVAQIAAQAAIQELPIEFFFMGDVESAIPLPLRKHCTFLGHKTVQNEIDKIYQQCHIVMITSSTEGFPLAIEEGMANGCAVIATPVGDIPVHVKNNANGFLFSGVDNENLIVEEGVSFLRLLANDRQLIKNISKKNTQYAYEHFDVELFNKAYRDLFTKLRGD